MFISVFAMPLFILQLEILCFLECCSSQWDNGCHLIACDYGFYLYRVTQEIQVSLVPCTLLMEVIPEVRSIGRAAIHNPGLVVQDPIAFPGQDTKSWNLGGLIAKIIIDENKVTVPFEFSLPLSNKYKTNFCSSCTLCWKFIRYT